MLRSGDRLLEAMHRGLLVCRFDLQANADSVHNCEPGTRTFPWTWQMPARSGSTRAIARGPQPSSPWTARTSRSIAPIATSAAVWVPTSLLRATGLAEHSAARQSGNQNAQQRTALTGLHAFQSAISITDRSWCFSASAQASTCPTWQRRDCGGCRGRLLRPSGHFAQIEPGRAGVDRHSSRERVETEQIAFGLAVFSRAFEPERVLA